MIRKGIVDALAGMISPSASNTDTAEGFIPKQHPSDNQQSIRGTENGERISQEICECINIASLKKFIYMFSFSSNLLFLQIFS